MQKCYKSSQNAWFFKKILIFQQENWEVSCIITNYLKLRPIHWHIDSISIWPPPQVFFVISIVDCVVKLLIDLRKSEKMMKREEDKSLAQIKLCN